MRPSCPATKAASRAEAMSSMPTLSASTSLREMYRIDPSLPTNSAKQPVAQLIGAHRQRQQHRRTLPRAHCRQRPIEYRRALVLPEDLECDLVPEIGRHRHARSAAAEHVIEPVL